MEADLGRPLLEPETRSSDSAICPFLRAVDGDRLIEPVRTPDAANRCLAAGPAAAQDLDWQASACLVAAHVTCPRYLSGSAGASVTGVIPTSSAPGFGGDPARIQSSRTMTPAILLALAFLVTSAAAAVAFVGATGGLQLPTTAPSAVAIASPSPVASSSPAATASPTPTPNPTPVPTPAATTGPTPTVAPTVAPTSAPTPAATSNRYALLTPCPSKPDCYLYTVRTGDNLRSIANYFGVPYDTILALNPSIADPATIQPGTVLTLPPPTR